MMKEDVQMLLFFKFCGAEWYKNPQRSASDCKLTGSFTNALKLWLQV